MRGSIDGENVRLRVVRTCLAIVLMALLLSFQESIFGLGAKWPAYDREILRIALFVAAAALGGYAVREGTGFLLRRVSDPQAGVLWRNLLSWTLYVLLGLVVAANLGINLSSLLFGGAIIGIVIAAAAQASLGNFFAGLVLLMARPYRIGAPVRIHALSVDYEGTIVDQNALYLTMRLADGEILRLPNQAVITSPIFTGRPPIQATMSLVLPAQAQLEQLRRRIENQLSVARAVVTLTPQSLDGTQDGKLNCELEVRCAQPVALSRLTEALQAALNDPAPETPSLETAAATPRTPPEGSTTSPRPARARRA